MSDNAKIPHIKSVETRHLEERETLFRGLHRLDRRSFPQGVHGRRGRGDGRRSVQSLPQLPAGQRGLCRRGRRAGQGFTFAYISDSHLYAKKTNERFVRQLLRAVDDINSLDPQPDFVFYGGDLAQLGRKEELDLGAQILKSIKAPRAHDGRRARLVFRHGPSLERTVRSANLQLRP